MDAAEEPTIGIQHQIAMRVSNLGTAIIEILNPAEQRFGLKPLVSVITPSRGSKGGSTRLTISGSGYEGSVLNTDVIVTVGGSLCNIISMTYTEIVCLTPTAINDGAQPFEVKVGPNMMTADCDITCQFVYESIVTPSASAVTPTTINGTATTLTISGSKFNNVTGDIGITVGGEDCSVTLAEMDTIECVITNVPHGVQPVLVDVHSKGRAVTSSPLQVTSQEVITSVTPNTGSNHGGTIVTITGNGFSSNQTTVSIGGVSCVVTTSTLSQVVCTTGAHAAGSVNVQVTSTSTNYPVASFDYANAATPTINTVSPATGTAGETITIDGVNFSGTMSNNVVTVGGETCTVSTATTTQIVCDVGNLRAGAYPVNVDVVGLGVSNNDKTYTFTMTATSITPNTGI